MWLLLPFSLSGTQNLRISCTHNTAQTNLIKMQMWAMSTTKWSAQTHLNPASFDDIADQINNTHSTTQIMNTLFPPWGSFGLDLDLSAAQPAPNAWVTTKSSKESQILLVGCNSQHKSYRAWRKTPSQKGHSKTLTKITQECYTALQRKCGRTNNLITLRIAFCLRGEVLEYSGCWIFLAIFGLDFGFRYMAFLVTPCTKMSTIRHLVHVWCLNGYISTTAHPYVLTPTWLKL